MSRLLPYKNVDVVVEALRRLPDLRLVVVGTGPEADRLAAGAPANVTFLGRVADDGLRWLYAASAGLVTASWEDFGLTPVEAAAFGRPTAALRWGGFLDTIEEGRTGILFDRPDVAGVAAAVESLVGTGWSERELVDHAARYAPARFVAEIDRVVDEERRRG